MADRADALKEIREAIERALRNRLCSCKDFWPSFEKHPDDCPTTLLRSAIARLSELEAAEGAQAPEEPCECDGDSAPHSHRKPPAPREPEPVLEHAFQQQYDPRRGIGCSRCGFSKSSHRLVPAPGVEGK